MNSQDPHTSFDETISAPRDSVSNSVEITPSELTSSGVPDDDLSTLTIQNAGAEESSRVANSQPAHDVKQTAENTSLGSDEKTTSDRLAVIASIESAFRSLCTVASRIESAVADIKATTIPLSPADQVAEASANLEAIAEMASSCRTCLADEANMLDFASLKEMEVAIDLVAVFTGFFSEQVRCLATPPFSGPQTTPTSQTETLAVGKTPYLGSYRCAKCDFVAVSGDGIRAHFGECLPKPKHKPGETTEEASAGPSKKRKPAGERRHGQCGLCQYSNSDSRALARHFEKCVAERGNPAGLRWYDHPSCDGWGSKDRKKDRAEAESSGVS